MSDNPINAAIIGTGFMSWVHAEALRRINIPIAGVLGSSTDKSQAAAESLGLARAYESFDDVISDADVHSIHICTPNDLHFEMAKAALLAGKHVLCEKPLAINSSESAELVELAKSHPNLAAGVNYNIRYFPLCVEARSRTQTKDVGDVVHVTGSYTQDWLSTQDDYNWRLLSDKGGELRAMADIGTHWLDLIQFITGLKIESVCADLKTVFAQRNRPVGEVDTFAGSQNISCETESIAINTEDFGAVLLRFEGGARGCFHVSQVIPGHKNCLRFEIAGSDQSLAWNSEQPNELQIGNRHSSNHRLIRDPALLSQNGQHVTSYPGGHNEGYPDSFKQCFRDFYSHIQNAKWNEPCSFPSFADGHREVLLCEAILKSHREEKWVSIQEVS
ncbi:MAG: dehydrogenase [Rickettsiales bacterium]|nr:dehydrogenase [Rickettsiales bacterium]|tara:strand:+ start:13522 stop:14688 length:1167 start_codon:yes stop_codon:yes gene_type:complete